MRTSEGLVVLTLTVDPVDALGGGGRRAGHVAVNIRAGTGPGAQARHLVDGGKCPWRRVGLNWYWGTPVGPALTHCLSGAGSPFRHLHSDSPVGDALAAERARLSLQLRCRGWKKAPGPGDGLQSCH